MGNVDRRNFVHQLSHPLLLLLDGLDEFELRAAAIKVVSVALNLEIDIAREIIGEEPDAEGVPSAGSDSHELPAVGPPAPANTPIKAIKPGDYDLVITCIGYTGEPYPKGEGVFAVGWARRGPSRASSSARGSCRRAVRSDRSAPRNASKFCRTRSWPACMKKWWIVNRLMRSCVASQPWRPPLRQRDRHAGRGERAVLTERVTGGAIDFYSSICQFHPGIVAGMTINAPAMSKAKAGNPLIGSSVIGEM